MVPHKSGYRSVHYLIKVESEKTPTIVELQVRTLFEEGWSEIDHLVRYPHGVNHPVLSHQLGLLNRLAGSADEMGSFVTVLQEHLKDTAEKEVAFNREIATFEERITKLEIDEKEKTSLTKDLRSFPALALSRPWSEIASSMMVPGSSGIAKIATMLTKNLDSHAASFAAFDAVNTGMPPSSAMIARSLAGTKVPPLASVMAASILQNICPRCRKKLAPEVEHVCD